MHVRFSMDQIPRAAEPTKVVFLGPLGTYSHQAVRNFVGDEQAVLEPRTSIQEAVQYGAENARIGCPVVVMMPVENSTLGIVHEALECMSDPALFRPDGLRIVDEVDLTVAHALIIKAPNTPHPRPFDAIQQVHSHEQALGQCAEFLDANLPHATRSPTHSTAEAVAMLEHCPPGTVAAIASEICADMFGMHVLARSVQMSKCEWLTCADHLANFTRFLICTNQVHDTGVARMLGNYRADRLTQEIHAAFRLTVATDNADTYGKITTALQNNALGPWSLRGEVYAYSPPGSSTRHFVFEMQAAQERSESVGMSGESTQAVRTALGLTDEAVFTCLGMWSMPVLPP